MRQIAVENFQDWREKARALVAGRVRPEDVRFTDGLQDSLFADEPMPAAGSRGRISVPRAFLARAEIVSLHRDAKRWDLLYQALFRVVNDGLPNEPDELLAMEQAVSRDIHKMHAFVRFRKIVGDDGQAQYIAWYRPDHHIVKHVAPWFAERFGAMHWAILTPDVSAYWDTKTLRFGDGVPRSAAPQEDELEELWRSYYASIFNPARVNVRAMTREMPVRHWSTMPEAALIPALVSNARGREQQMRERAPASAEPFVPVGAELPVLAAAVRACRGCELYACATQPVFGEGPERARLMLVGEQPGDQEDLHGRPFVGPAGQLLDRALQEAGVDRSSVYVTNAVKHFKFEERGKRRIHKKPDGGEVAACRPWLTAEIERVDPQLIVALGATAALSLGGREFAIQKERGRMMPLPGGRQLLITVHPSFLLRVPDAAKAAEFARFVQDLRLTA
jgi:probable DNA metabolism protein